MGRESKLHGTLKSEAVQFLIKNQLPTSIAYDNLIGLTAGGGGLGELRYLDLAVNSRMLCL